MTKSMQYTPPSDSATRTARDFALRGNMGKASFLTRSDGTDGFRGGLTRSEIIRDVRAKRPIVASTREMQSIRRVAVVSRKPSISGFHAIGLGNLPQITLNELKAKLGVNGFTDMKIGKSIRNLTTGKRVTVNRRRLVSI